MENKTFIYNKVPSYITASYSLQVQIKNSTFTSATHRHVKNPSSMFNPEAYFCKAAGVLIYAKQQV